MERANFISIASTEIVTLDRAEGPSVVATASGDADRGLDAEVYAAHGLVSRPSKKTKAIRIRIGSLSIVIGAYTYGVQPPANPGAAKLYSTDADGAEQGSHLVDNDGTHVFNEGTKEAARKGDAVQSTMTDDATFWTWIAAAGAVLTGLGVAAPIPTSLSGKITEGTSEVLLP
jgi:hypothetical protein